MRRGLLVSFLLHAGAVSLALSLAEAGPSRREPRVSFHVARTTPAEQPEPPPPPPEFPAPPALPEPVDEPDEPVEPEAPADFEPLPFERAPLARDERPQPPIRLRRPLRRPPPKADAEPAPARPEPPPRDPDPARPTLASAPSPPRVLRCPAPRYPSRARRLGQEGTVRLRLHIDEEGAVVRVELIRGSGYALLDRAALKAARAWRFHPALRDGEPVADVIVQPVEFRLR